MRPVLALLLALLATHAAAAPAMRIVNDAHLPADTIRQIQARYGDWALRVYRYNHVAQPLPVNLVITHAVDIGYYTRPNVYLPADETAAGMLETFVHELAHHATGHESSFFFKEGIATRTAEALFAEDGRQIEGWPQYGVSTDAWVRLFMQRGELPPLHALVEKTGYDNSSRDAEFRSWQSYLIAASFLGWLIDNEGYDTFRTVFWEEELGPQGAEWERRWLASLSSKNMPAFDVATTLPQTARYAYYARRLRG